MFWYRYWYNDRISPAYMQQDIIFEKLLYTYLLFGILTPHHLFFSRHWHESIKNDSYPRMTEFNEKYYRIAEIKNSFLQELTLLRLRIKLKHFYFSKIWIFRFQGWLLMNFYSFQPLKKKTLKIKSNFRDIDTYSIAPLPRNNIWRKVKLFLISFLFYSANVTFPNL